MHIPSDFAHLLGQLECCLVHVAVKGANTELEEGVERPSLPFLSLVFYQKEETCIKKLCKEKFNQVDVST